MSRRHRTSIGRGPDTAVAYNESWSAVRAINTLKVQPYDMPTCASGHTCQFVIRAGINMSLYFRHIWSPSLPSMTPIEPINIASYDRNRLDNEQEVCRVILTPIGAISNWSAATRLDNARTLTLPVAPLLVCIRKGKWRSRKKFHRPIKGPAVSGVHYLHLSSWGFHAYPSQTQKRRNAAYAKDQRLADDHVRS